MGRSASCVVAGSLQIAGTMAGCRTGARTSRTRRVTRPTGSKPVTAAVRSPVDSYVRTGDRMPAASASLPTASSTDRRNDAPSVPSRMRNRR